MTEKATVKIIFKMTFFSMILHVLNPPLQKEKCSAKGDEGDQRHGAAVVGKEINKLCLFSMEQK